MQTTVLSLALIPALALAASDASGTATAKTMKTATVSGDASSSITDFTTLGDWPSSLAGCATASEGNAAASCNLAAEGFNSAAASYLASVESLPAFSALDRDFESLTAVQPWATHTGTEQVGSTDGPGILSLYLSAPSGVNEEDRGFMSSVLGEALALQSGSSVAQPSSSSSIGKAAAAPVQTASLGVAAGVAAGIVGLALGL